MELNNWAQKTGNVVELVNSFHGPSSSGEWIAIVYSEHGYNAQIQKTKFMFFY